MNKKVAYGLALLLFLAAPLYAFLVVALENKLGEVGSWLAERSVVAWFAGLGESVGMVTGLIFIVCVLLFRRGIVGEIAALLGRGRKLAA